MAAKATTGRIRRGRITNSLEIRVFGTRCIPLRTPLDHRLPKSNDELTFTFKMAGHHTEKRTVAPSADAEVKATLAKLGGVAKPKDDGSIKTGR